MEKLKKLKSLNKIFNLYHYKITINKDQFYIIKGIKYNVNINDDNTITFNCYKKIYNEIKNFDNIKIENIWKTSLSIIFIKRILFTILFILITFIFFISNRIIREIKFIDQEMYDQRIYDYVYKNLNKKGLVYTYNQDLNKLSLELRANFPNYAYIGVTRNASCLLIEIEKIAVKTEEEKLINKPCDIISKTNAVIYSIESKVGVIKVELNQFVKKGDVLISGNLLIDNKPDDYTKLVESNGIIVGTLLAKEEYVIKKQKKLFTYTGEFKKRLNVGVNNKIFFDFKNYYQQQNIKLTEKFNLLNIIRIYEEKYYEQDFVDIIYDYESAYNYAVSMIYYKLELNKVSQDEEILEVKLISCIESSDAFKFNFIVKKRQSIGIKQYYII